VAYNEQMNGNMLPSFDGSKNEQLKSSDDGSKKEILMLCSKVY